MTSQHTASKVLQSLSNETLERLKTASVIEHGGEIGRAREQILRDHLTRMLPAGLGITTGFVIDALGGVSKQIDIIIHFTDYCPTFVVGGVPLIPVEAVAAVLEIKSNLDGVATLHECYNNIRSVKELDRSNRGRNIDLTEGTPRELNPSDWNHFYLNVFGAIIAFKGITAKTWADGSTSWLEANTNMNQWTNAVCVTGADRPIKGFIGAFRDEVHNAFTPNPSLSRNLVAFQPRPEHPLAWITAEILNFLRVARRVDYSPRDYLWAGPPADDRLLIEEPLPADTQRYTVRQAEVTQHTGPIDLPKFLVSLKHRLRPQTPDPK